MNQSTNHNRKSLFVKAFLRRLPKGLAIFSALCLLFLFFKASVLDTTPEFFNGAHKVGLILENILLSMISSFVFFISLNTYSETKKELSKLNHLELSIKKATSECQQLVSALTHHQEKNVECVTLSDLCLDSSPLKNLCSTELRKNHATVWCGMIPSKHQTGLNSSITK